MSQEFDNTGKSALWVSKSEHPKAPLLKGHVYAHRDIAKGEKVALAFWPNEGYEKGGSKPRFRGKVEDVRTGGGESAPVPVSRAADEPDDFRDGLPF